MSYARKKVVWKKPEELPQENVEAKLRPHIKGDSTAAEEVPFAPFLYGGSPFVVERDLEQMHIANDVLAPPFPYLQRPWMGDKIVVKKGALAMYAGTVRVEEAGKHSNLRIVRHTFIVGGGRYIVPNLTWFKPLVD